MQSSFGPQFRELPLGSLRKGLNFEYLVYNVDGSEAFYISRDVPAFGTTRELQMTKAYNALPEASRQAIAQIPVPNIDGQPILRPNEIASFRSDPSLEYDILVKRIQGPPLEYAAKNLGYRPTIEQITPFVRTSAEPIKVELYGGFSLHPYVKAGSAFDIAVTPTGEMVFTGDGMFVHALGGEKVQYFDQTPGDFAIKQARIALQQVDIDLPKDGPVYSVEALAKHLGITLNALNIVLMTGLVETSGVAITYKDSNGLSVTLDKASQIVTNRTIKGAEQQKVCFVALNGITEQNAGPIMYSYDLLPVEGSGVGPMTPVTQIETKDQDGGNIEQWFCDYFIQFRISQAQDGRPVLHFDRPTASGQGVSAHIEGKLDNVSVDIPPNGSVILTSDFTYTVTTSTGYEYVVGTGYGPEAYDKWFYVTIKKAPYNLSQPS